MCVITDNRLMARVGLYREIRQFAFASCANNLSRFDAVVATNLRHPFNSPKRYFSAQVIRLHLIANKLGCKLVDTTISNRVPHSVNYADLSRLQSAINRLMARVGLYREIRQVASASCANNLSRLETVVATNLRHLFFMSCAWCELVSFKLFERSNCAMATSHQSQFTLSQLRSLLVQWLYASYVLTSLALVGLLTQQCFKAAVNSTEGE